MQKCFKMGFELPRVTRFMFCCSLRFGALFIGYFSMFSALVGLGSASFFIYLVALYVKQNKDHPPQGHTTEDIVNNAVRLYIIYAFQLFVYLFYFVISLMLVIGAHKRQPSYMRYFYIAGLINLVVNLVVVTVSFVFIGFLSTVSQLMSCVVLFYFLLVVRSAFLEMEEQTRVRDYEMKLYNPAEQQTAPPPAY